MQLIWVNRCSICLDEYAAGDRLIRLACRHSFHEACWTEILLREENPDCPCCRGGGRVIANFQYIDPESPQNEARDEFATPHGTPTFPWWPDAPTSSALHSTTQVPGHLSVVVDPGAWTNLAGQDWAERQAAAARTVGLRATCKTTTNPMSVRGVGEGTQACRHVATLPAHCSAKDSSPFSSRSFRLLHDPPWRKHII